MFSGYDDSVCLCFTLSRYLENSKQWKQGGNIKAHLASFLHSFHSLRKAQGCKSREKAL